MIIEWGNGNYPTNSVCVFVAGDYPCCKLENKGVSSRGILYIAPAIWYNISIYGARFKVTVTAPGPSLLDAGGSNVYMKQASITSRAGITIPPGADLSAPIMSSPMPAAIFWVIICLHTAWTIRLIIPIRVATGPPGQRSYWLVLPLLQRQQSLLLRLQAQLRHWLVLHGER